MFGAGPFIWPVSTCATPERACAVCLCTCTHTRANQSSPFPSAHHQARRQRERESSSEWTSERERESESPSRWKSQSKGSAVPKKHHTAPLLTFWSHPRGGRETTHFLNRIKTWRQAAPILLHAVDYTLVWSGVLSGTPRYWALPPPLLELFFIYIHFFSLNSTQIRPPSDRLIDQSRHGGVNRLEVRSTLAELKRHESLSPT